MDESAPAGCGFIRGGRHSTGDAAYRRPEGNAADHGRRYNDLVITNYVAAALKRARYQTVDKGLICATVPGLRGVIATAPTVEECRTALAEVIEAWLLVRVARGLRVPPLGRATVHVKRAS